MQSPYAHEMKINILRSQIKTHRKFLAATKFLCWLQLGLSAWMAAFAIVYLSTNKIAAGLIYVVLSIMNGYFHFKGKHDVKRMTDNLNEALEELHNLEVGGISNED